MIKKLIVAVSVILMLVSCQDKTAFDYSQDFVYKERGLISAIDSTEDLAEKYITAGKYDSMGIAGAKMEKRFDEVIDQIKQKPAPDAKQGKRFKDEVVRYFEFMKSIYTEYKDFGLASSEEEREAVKTRMRETLAGKPAAVARIQTEQKSFADANGFKIKPE